MQGVYKIENINNGKKYIGSSKDIEKRFYQHKRELKNKTHHSVKLQHAWSKAKNKDIFLFDVIEVVDDIGALKEREQYYVDLFDAYHSGYNCSLKVDNPRYAKKTLDKKKKASMIPKLREEFNILYDSERFYLRAWSLRKLIDGLYTYSSYNIVLTCMRWFLENYPEPEYSMQLDKVLYGNSKRGNCLWVLYKGQDFAKYDYFNGKVILDKEGTDSIIKYLDSKSMYDKLHHQVRGGIN